MSLIPYKDIIEINKNYADIPATYHFIYGDDFKPKEYLQDLGYVIINQSPFTGFYRVFFDNDIR